MTDSATPTDPQEPSRRRRRVLLGVAVALLALLVLAPVFLTKTTIGRAWLRDLYVWQASSAQRGTVHLDEIGEAGLDRWVFLGYSMTAPNGEEVMHTPELIAHLDEGALLEGRVRWRDAVFRGSTIRITEGPDGQVNLAHAQEVVNPRFWIPTVYEPARVEANTIVIDLPGKPSTTLTGVNGAVALRQGETFVWRMDRHEGTADLPLLEVGFTEMSGRLRTDHRTPLRIQMVLDLELVEPGARFVYRAPRAVGQEGAAYFDMELPADLSHPATAGGDDGEVGADG